MDHQRESNCAAWADLDIPDVDFDVAALHTAIDETRRKRQLSWNAVAHEVNRSGERRNVHPISPSTISGLKSKRWGVEGDGVLQMLLWLGRSPESFVPGHPGADHPEAQLPRVKRDQILRFDVALIYSKLEAVRSSRGLTWTEVAGEVGRFCSPRGLRSMRTQQRTAFPQIMWITRWLRCPAAGLTRIADW